MIFVHATGSDNHFTRRPEIKQGIHPNKKERPSPSGNVQSKVRKVNNGGPRTVANDDWELSCEICQRHGINLVCFI